MKHNHIVSIFGGTGDLSYRKLLPAFYNLMMRDELPDSFHIVIIGRRDYTSESYRESLRPWIEKHSRFKVSKEDLNRFLGYISYFKMTFTEEEGYPRLAQYFETLDPTAKKLYYFAVAPSFFEVIAENLAKFGLNKNGKIIIEKPFGNDLESAISINDTLLRYFDDQHIYRIDHYIAKEMVQNIFTIRFHNEIFQKIWNKDSIDTVQISASEEVGVETRGNFYDQTGALKDMFQNHLLQILSIVAMDEPENFDAKAMHKKQEHVLENLFIQDYQKDIVYGQYLHGQKKSLSSRSYRDEMDVNPESNTETFVALKLGIDCPRWKGVPFYIRTGKRMHKRSTEVVIKFKEHYQNPANILIIKIQPDEGVYFKFNIKKPGPSNEIQSVFMDFCQSCDIQNRLNTPEAYERLLDAAMLEDHTLFASFKQVRLSWKLTEDILKNRPKKQPAFYQAFTDGPQAAHDLLKRDGFEWIEEEVLGETHQENI